MAKDNQARNSELPPAGEGAPRVDVPRPSTAKPGLLTLTIKDKSALYLAYMPFVSNGGLFIPTNSNYRIGDEVFMLLNLMGEDEKLPVAVRLPCAPLGVTQITRPATGSFSSSPIRFSSMNTSSPMR